MIRVVCNSSPIIGLSKIGKLDLLWTLFDEVMIPEAVFEEIVPKRTEKIDKVRPYLDDLVQSGYRISKKLYDGTLERACE